MIVVGIDIGTTSVKVTLIAQVTPNRHEVLHTASRKHEADVLSPGAVYSEQDPAILRFSLETCIKSMASHVGDGVMQKIEAISICGQMHGCVLWNSESRNTEFYPHSNLITWRDQRCGEEFIKSLPGPENCTPASTGFGCASLFWMQRHKSNILDDYNCAGTIMDYITANLCQSGTPCISTQNAMSWGYYDFCREEWNVRILERSGFPVRLLPEIKRPGVVIGPLKFDWCGIKAGSRILVGLGDTQCSVLSCNPNRHTAVFNLGTSAQLSVISPIETGRAFYKEKKLGGTESRICVPYFGRDCLWTSASLNGGAVFDRFVTEVYEWTRLFAASVTKEDVYHRIQDDAASHHDKPGATMKITPTIFGERHAPCLKGIAENISVGDCKIPRIASEIATGIIRNVFGMFLGEKDSVFDDVREVWGCGTPFRKNKLFRTSLETVSGLHCAFDNEVDAALGAALFAAYSSS